MNFLCQKHFFILKLKKSCIEGLNRLRIFLPPDEQELSCGVEPPDGLEQFPHRHPLAETHHHLGVGVLLEVADDLVEVVVLRLAQNGVAGRHANARVVGQLHKGIHATASVVACGERHYVNVQFTKKNIRSIVA
ncbi:hypothetical protein AVEN_122846-1 [Araneus ventricosus]|uniref:Uncharacterized protein n=1 Tax=Araneus ventricosus TaxID=182803 RepID=A0A4Y2N1R1_ARAVE|nr:hypothetical protein AVEN_122846-1 [Araneus ventricosus]